MRGHNRVRAAWIGLVLAVVAGVFFTGLWADTGFEQVVMGVSWTALALTAALDVMVATNDAKED